MTAETSTNNLETQQQIEAAPIAPNETQEIRLEAHDTVANLVPDEVHPREKKSYRDAGGGGWRIWK